MTAMKTKRLFAALAVAILLANPPFGLARTNKTLTITAGTPIQLSATQVFAREIFIQMQSGGSGIGYVMDMNGYPAGTTPSHSTSGNLTAQLSNATSTNPGGAYSDNCAARCIDISKVWIDGSNNGDTVTVSWD